MKIVTRRRERKAHAERVRRYEEAVARWEEAMERWESRELPEPTVVFNPAHRLTREEVREIRDKLAQLYRQEGRRFTR